VKRTLRDSKQNASLKEVRFYVDGERSIEACKATSADAETFSYWEAYTYLASDSSDQIALANKVAGREPTRFSTWAEENFPKKLNATDGASL